MPAKRDDDAVKVTFRVSSNGRRILADLSRLLSKKHGIPITKTSVVELALRQLATHEGLKWVR